jgi:hypothetical protein
VPLILTAFIYSIRLTSVTSITVYLEVTLLTGVTLWIGISYLLHIPEYCIFNLNSSENLKFLTVHNIYHVATKSSVITGEIKILA